MDERMTVEICGVRLKNPIIAASGTFGFGREFAGIYDIERLGGISVKGLTLLPRQGNPPPRVAETPSGMLNSVGLQNPGVDAFLANELPWLLEQNTCVIANIAGSTMEEYVAMAQKLAPTKVHLIELNISCPNVKEGGVAFGTQPGMVEGIVRAVKAAARQPLVVKLSPNVADIRAIARAAEAGGADALSLINTVTGMAIDAHTRRPILANITGGLSGPAVKPIALRMVWEVVQATQLPIIGMGGIQSGEDVVEFLLAGATAVMVGTANLYDPMACPRILSELRAFLRQESISDVRELIGALKL